jgi:type II secretory pathway pseudopilin PulG
VWETVSGHLFIKEVSGSMERGASQVEFLAVLLIFCIGMAIAWPHLSLSRSATAEAKATSTLKVLHEAQRDFYGGRQYYGSEQQLKDFGVLAGVELKQSNQQAAVGLETNVTYSIEISVAGGRQRWCAVAVPTPSGRTITIDETGKIRTDATCYDGIVQ